MLINIQVFGQKHRLSTKTQSATYNKKSTYFFIKFTT